MDPRLGSRGVLEEKGGDWHIRVRSPTLNPYATLAQPSRMNLGLILMEIVHYPLHFTGFSSGWGGAPPLPQPLPDLISASARFTEFAFMLTEHL